MVLLHPGSTKHTLFQAALVFLCFSLISKRLCHHFCGMIAVLRHNPGERSRVRDSTVTYELQCLVCEHVKPGVEVRLFSCKCGTCHILTCLVRMTMLRMLLFCLNLCVMQDFLQNFTIVKCSTALCYCPLCVRDSS